MAMQVIHIHQRDVERKGQSLGKRGAHMQRTWQTGAAREGDSIDVTLVDTCLTDSLTHHRHDVLLVGTRCQFGHHATISLMHPLTGNDITQQHSVTQHRCRRIVARRLYPQYRYTHRS